MFGIVQRGIPRGFELKERNGLNRMGEMQLSWNEVKRQPLTVLARGRWLVRTI